MIVYKPTKSLSKFIDDIEKGVFNKDVTYIILGKNGPTGKTYLADWLKKKGFNAIEITEDLLGYVSYIDDKNHFVLNRFGDTITVLLNEPLIKESVY